MLIKKQFKDINDGETIKYNGIEYQKIPLIKVSCCRSHNAQAVANANQKTFIAPTQEVEFDDQL